MTKLRQGPALARPTALLSALDDPVRAYLCRARSCASGSPEQIAAVSDTIRGAIDQLSDDERLYARVDFNLHPDHHFPTLTERQESLATHQKCASKTIRRHSAQALDTLAYLLLSVHGRSTELTAAKHPGRRGHPGQEHTPAGASNAVRDFWHLHPGAQVDIVCSEIPGEERPEYASPSDRNYLRYAKFADLDTLIFVRTGSHKRHRRSSCGISLPPSTTTLTPTS